MEKLREKTFLLSQDIGIGNKFLIEEKLKKRVKEVFTLKDELDDSRKDILYKVFKEITNKLSEENILKKFYFKYRKSLVKKNIEKYKEIDYFIIMGNVEFSDYFFEEFIKKFPEVKIILFLWDKLEYSHWLGRLQYFYKVFSYDRIDSIKNNFIFRPTFFIGECLENIPMIKKNDLYYIGVLREMKRYEYLLEINKYLIENNLKPFFKLYVRKKRLKELPEDYERELIMTKKISYLENIEISKNSKVILDIKYKNQDGMSLRIFEALAMDAKIITDNKDIENYDFYNEKNIKIINDIEDIKDINRDFFITEAEKIDEKIKYKYSIDGFLDDILKRL